MKAQFADRQTTKTPPEGVLAAIGATPLLSIEGIYAKLETVNPTGSIKDRVALHLVRKAERRGELKPGGTIIEATSGNTGIALAMISAVKNYRFVAVMPESNAVEKQWMMQRFGAEVVLTPAREGMAGALHRCEQLAQQCPGAWLPRQFRSRENIAANAQSLGREIVEQTGGLVDIFVAGAGTGATLLGVAQALRRVNPDVEIVAVEPDESPVLSGGKTRAHGIEGIGEGFIPPLLAENMHLIDRIARVPSSRAIAMSSRLARREGLWVGPSSGANVAAALDLRRRGARVVTVLPDSGERYLSTMRIDASGQVLQSEVSAATASVTEKAVLGLQPDISRYRH